MSCEVALQNYLYFQLEQGGARHGMVGDPAETDLDSIDNVLSAHVPSTEVMVDAVDAAEQSSAISAKFPFVYNPLHDMESVWWIWVWITFFHTNRPDGRTPQKQQNAFRSLFPSVIPNGERVINKPLDLDALPHLFHHMGFWVKEARRELVLAYIVSEKTLPPNYITSHQKIYRYFFYAVQQVMYKYQDSDKFYKPFGLEKRKAATTNNPEPLKRVKQS